MNFCGRVPFDELLNHLQSSHVFVFPTLGEGFGLVLLESMAAGLPVITTSNCGGADIVSEGKDGFLIKVGDVDSLIDRIMWIKNNPNEAFTMSAEAIKKQLTILGLNTKKEYAVA